MRRMRTSIYTSIVMSELCPNSAYVVQQDLWAALKSEFLQ